ncbi:LytTR family DNA-binding domain-containing protein [Solibacillus sp. FSL K6-1523]|uniref:LytTR family DNA-binding domain-containing protein n=1 Tax=Solibacillus sp. FSL K6-1523 TaxID=2921471 RepID=UPI0030F767E6
MKIHLVINNELEETEIHIHAKEYNEQIEQLMRQLQSTQVSKMIDGYLKQEIHMLKIDEIYSIYADGSKVYLQTEEQEFEAKKKLYELEEQFAKDFVRVNKSTLINLNKIASIQLATIGTTQVLLDNGVSIHISRKYLKELKVQLGIGRGY